VAREVGRELSAGETEAIQVRHGAIFRELLPKRRPLPGGRELLEDLRNRRIVHGIATSGRRPEIDLSLEVLGVGDETVVVDRGDVARAKPEPDLFLACQAALRVAPDDCYVVGDAVWDLLAARRAHMLSVGLLSGGYGSDELLSAGALRVYNGPAELHESLDEPLTGRRGGASGYSVLVGVADGLCTVTCAGLGEDVVDVGLDGRVADDERGGDFGVRQAGRDQPEDLSFARG
jgi:HAD superfamily hydrolase (TIGR01509 family)